MIKKNTELSLAVIGLGYVGLPLAVEFAKKRKIIGFDIQGKRIQELKLGYDRNLEFKKNELGKLKNLFLTNKSHDLKSANCYIITVPTPITRLKNPDLNPLASATKIVSQHLKKGNLIIYESTVYPGCIEEFCVPIIEKVSGLKFNYSFFCGYSPERINPGDKKHTITNIKKVTSGSNKKIAKIVDDLYNEIIKAGTHKASSIQVAEAAKVIENTQRDLNIALMNELSIIFHKMNIDTQEVLNAASTKWNFMPFLPGLVGGHCIGVDPYYLTYKAKKIGYNPKIILSGRNLNDTMGKRVTIEFIKYLRNKSIKVVGAKILIMGLSFKENCTDIRNSRVFEIYSKLKRYKCKIELYDPWVNIEDIKELTKINPISKFPSNYYDGIIIATAHDYFKDLGILRIKKWCKKNHVIFDLKGLFVKDKVDFRL